MAHPQPDTTNHSLSHQSQPNTDHWNGAAGAVRTPNENGADTMSDAGHQSIKEGKQKARDPMPSNQPNGTSQLSRKRSRDGTRLPLSQAGSSASVTSEDTKMHSEILLDRYIQRDLQHAAVMNDHTYQQRTLMKSKDHEKDFYMKEMRVQRQTAPGSVFGPGYLGYGNGTTDGPTKIIYTAHRPPPKSRRSRQLYIPRKDNAQQAEQHEELVPIRLDIELDKLRLRDTFTWNLHEKLISQDAFTDYLLEDLKIPPEAMYEVSRQVKSEMSDQIHNFYPHIIVEDGPLEPHKPYADHKDDEMRILIKLNITIGRITLLDQFEWDINNPHNSPEEFARQMAWENALSGEFTTAIAHSIREQSQLYTKSLYLTNHYFDGRPVEDADVRDAFLPCPIYSPFRPPQAQKDWAPYMFEMTEADLERAETSMMREHRAQKRQLNRRGGPALPDLKDRQRTVRSLVIHSVIPGAAESMEMTGIPKTRRAGRAGRRPGARVDGDADSDDLDSEESGAESPAPGVNTGFTARTRNMRGAASAAKEAMRANYSGARSVTPDPQMLVAEPRASTRRSMLREESMVEDETLIVKLKIGRGRLKAWWDEYRAKKRASEYPLSGYAAQPPPPVATPAKGPMAAILGTPGVTPKAGSSQARGTPQPNGSGHHRAASSSGRVYDEHGRTEMDRWPHPDDEPVPPPPWLRTAVQTLRKTHPTSDFEPIMRASGLNIATGALERPSLEPGAPPPEGVKLVWVPKLRCNDCPGKVYNALPGSVVEDFEVHLRNRKHRETVDRRQQSGTPGGSGR